MYLTFGTATIPLPSVPLRLVQCTYYYYYYYYYYCAVDDAR